MRVVGGPRTEVTPAGRAVDLSKSREMDYAVLVPQGETVNVVRNNTFVVTTGRSGATTRFVLPNGGADEVRIRNRAGGAVYLEPAAGFLETARTRYLLKHETCVVKPSEPGVWWIVEGE